MRLISSGHTSDFNEPVIDGLNSVVLPPFAVSKLRSDAPMLVSSLWHNGVARSAALICKFSVLCAAATSRSRRTVLAAGENPVEAASRDITTLATKAR